MSANLLYLSNRAGKSSPTEPGAPANAEFGSAPSSGRRLSDFAQRGGAFLFGLIMPRQAAINRAKLARHRAFLAHKDAMERGDTRDINLTRKVLIRATADVLRAGL